MSFLKAQQQNFNYVMRSKTLHETSCIYLHPVEQSGLRITVVSFVDIMRRWLSGLWSMVPDICHNTQKSSRKWNALSRPNRRIHTFAIAF